MAEAPPRAFVCGHPIAHSRSPLIHGHWLKAHAIAGSYEAVDIAPDDLETFLERTRVGAFVGGNVTLPHKEGAFRLVDRRDAAAQAIGAVNTIWMEGSTLCGGNTDAYGFAANLDEAKPGWDEGGPRTALVIGAGGASRAVIHALVTRRFQQVRVFNRTVDRARDLASAFGPPVSAHPLGDLARFAADASLVVNTSSIGMHDDAPLPFDPGLLSPASLVTDIVYVPLETPLLAAARARNLATVDGLGMLLHQAVPGFQRWFGVRPAVTVQLRALIAADIERNAR